MFVLLNMALEAFLDPIIRLSDINSLLSVIFISLVDSCSRQGQPITCKIRTSSHFLWECIMIASVLQQDEQCL